MRIVLDWHAARTHAPGSGRYLRELTRALAELAEPDIDLVRLDWGRASTAELPAGAHGAASDLPLVRRPWPRRWSSWCGYLGLAPADLAPGGVVHTARTDLVPGRAAGASLAVAELPSEPRQREALRRRAAAADLLVVFSPLWRRRVAEELQVPAERVHAVPVGCEHWARGLERPPERGSDILILGARTLDGGQLELARAVRDLRREGWRGRLVCAGRPGPADGELRALDARGEWLVLGTPAECELPALVGGAGVLVHLAADPGTPVTPLEGLALGTPVLCRRSAVLEEALGASAGWCDEADLQDPRRLAQQLLRTLGRVAGAAEREVVARHSWPASAQAHLALWRTSRSRA